MQKIEELKAQVVAESLAKKEQDVQLQNLKADAEKREELITAIDTSMQCQICMDTLHRPYSLSPCGHVLCLNCLQEWFRKAPPAADDSDMDPNEQDDPHYILTRSKSCPCCRAVVTRRPVPIFVVKAITTALAKYKSGPGAGSGRRSPSPDQEDPWRGLFRPSSGEEEEEEEEEDGDVDDIDISSDDEYGDVIGWGLHGGFQTRDIHIAHRLALSQQSYMLRYEGGDDSGSGSATGSASGSEDGIGIDDEDGAENGSLGSIDSDDEVDISAQDVYGVYVPAEWEPPSVTVAEEYVSRNEGVASSTLRLLRRGCTLDMIRLFGMAYTHSRGLVAHLWSLDELWPDELWSFPTNTVPRNHRVFLGWNVKLGEADYSGERYMRWVLTDLKENPTRWTWVERTNTAGESVRGAYDVTRLVRLQDVEDYDTTDTEVWLDANDSYH
ncbi:hypothetical protein DXG03_004180 [Asterophora parasitica]|uniref:RING-type domain-containing protein n=1 Tax=Asterophora parasitica TaxID=117018 RepID=A0A9P7G2W7_9AGAR|nr:hypothetical protein DXG03_004180 [Asterophora parasitica]